MLGKSRYTALKSPLIFVAHSKMEIQNHSAELLYLLAGTVMADVQKHDPTAILGDDNVVWSTVSVEGHGRVPVIYDLPRGFAVVSVERPRGTLGQVRGAFSGIDTHARAYGFMPVFISDLPESMRARYRPS